MANSETEKDTKHAQAAKHEQQTAGSMRHDAGVTEVQRGHSEQMMGNAMSATERIGSGMVGGVTHVATDLVHGVGTIGGEVVTVVRDTANSAIAGVGSIGETAVHTVTILLSDLVVGLRDIGASAMRGRSDAAAEDESRSQGARRQPEDAMH